MRRFRRNEKEKISATVFNGDDNDSGCQEPQGLAKTFLNSQRYRRPIKKKNKLHKVQIPKDLACFSSSKVKLEPPKNAVNNIFYSESIYSDIDVEIPSKIHFESDMLPLCFFDDDNLETTNIDELKKRLREKKEIISGNTLLIRSYKQIWAPALIIDISDDNSTFLIEYLDNDIRKYVGRLNIQLANDREDLFLKRRNLAIERRDVFMRNQRFYSFLDYSLNPTNSIFGIGKITKLIKFNVPKNILYQKKSLEKLISNLVREIQMIDVILFFTDAYKIRLKEDDEFVESCIKKNFPITNDFEKTFIIKPNPIENYPSIRKIAGKMQQGMKIFSLSGSNEIMRIRFRARILSELKLFEINYNDHDLLHFVNDIKWQISNSVSLTFTSKMRKMIRKIKKSPSFDINLARCLDEIIVNSISEVTSNACDDLYESLANEKIYFEYDFSYPYNVSFDFQMNYFLSIVDLIAVCWKKASCLSTFTLFSADDDILLPKAALLTLHLTRLRDFLIHNIQPQLKKIEKEINDYFFLYGKSIKLPMYDPTFNYHLKDIDADFYVSKISSSGGNTIPPSKILSDFQVKEFQRISQCMSKQLYDILFSNTTIKTANFILKFLKCRHFITKRMKFMRLSLNLMLFNHANSLIEQLQAKLQLIYNKVIKEPNTISVFLELRKFYIEEISIIFNNMKLLGNSIKEVILFLESISSPLVHILRQRYFDFQLRNHLFMETFQIRKAKLEDSKSEISIYHKAIEADVLSKIALFEYDLNHLLHTNVSMNINEIYENSIEINEKYENLLPVINELNLGKGILSHNVFDQTHFNKSLNVSRNLRILWKLVKELTDTNNEIAAEPIRLLDLNLLRKKYNNWNVQHQQIRSSLVAFPIAKNVSDKLYNTMREFSFYLPIIETLTSPIMRKRHSAMIEGLFLSSNADSYIADASSTLYQLIDIQVLKFKEQIQEIFDLAYNEYQCEKKIDVLINELTHISFILTIKNLKRFLVISNGIVDKQNKEIINMKKSKFSSPFLNRIETHLQTISDFSDVLFVLTEVNKIYYKLKPFITSEDTKNHNRSLFDSFNSLRKELSSELHLSKYVSIISAKVHVFMSILKKFQKIHKLLNPYLFSRKSEYIRFSILTNEEFFYLVSSSHKYEQFYPRIRYVLPNIHSLILDKEYDLKKSEKTEYMILGIKSKNENESLFFYEPFPFKINHIDVFFEKLDNQLKITIKNQVFSLLKRNYQYFLKQINLLPFQVMFLYLNIKFTQLVGDKKCITNLLQLQNYVNEYSNLKKLIKEKVTSETSKNSLLHLIQEFSRILYCIPIMNGWASTADDNTSPQKFIDFSENKGSSIFKNFSPKKIIQKIESQALIPRISLSNNENSISSNSPIKKNIPKTESLTAMKTVNSIFPEKRKKTPKFVKYQIENESLIIRINKFSLEYGYEYLISSDVDILKYPKIEDLEKFIESISYNRSCCLSSYDSFISNAFLYQIASFFGYAFIDVHLGICSTKKDYHIQYLDFLHFLIQKNSFIVHFSEFDLLPTSIQFKICEYIEEEFPKMQGIVIASGYELSPIHFYCLRPIILSNEYFSLHQQQNVLCLYGANEELKDKLIRNDLLVQKNLHCNTSIHLETKVDEDYSIQRDLFKIISVNEVKLMSLNSSNNNINFGTDNNSINSHTDEKRIIWFRRRITNELITCFLKPIPFLYNLNGSRLFLENYYFVFDCISAVDVPITIATKIKWLNEPIVSNEEWNILSDICGTSEITEFCMEQVNKISNIRDDQLFINSFVISMAKTIYPNLANEIDKEINKVYDEETIDLFSLAEKSLKINQRSVILVGSGRSIEKLQWISKFLNGLKLKEEENNKLEEEEHIEVKSQGEGLLFENTESKPFHNDNQYTKNLDYVDGKIYLNNMINIINNVTDFNSIEFEYCFGKTCKNDDERQTTNDNENDHVYNLNTNSELLLNLDYDLKPNKDNDNDVFDFDLKPNKDFSIITINDLNNFSFEFGRYWQVLPFDAIKEDDIYETDSVEDALLYLRDNFVLFSLFCDFKEIPSIPASKIFNDYAIQSSTMTFNEFIVDQLSQEIQNIRVLFVRFQSFDFLELFESTNFNEILFYSDINSGFTNKKRSANHKILNLIKIRIVIISSLSKYEFDYFFSMSNKTSDFFRLFCYKNHISSSLSTISVMSCRSNKSSNSSKSNKSLKSNKSDFTPYFKQKKFQDLIDQKLQKDNIEFDEQYGFLFSSQSCLYFEFCYNSYHKPLAEKISFLDDFLNSFSVLCEFENICINDFENTTNSLISLNKEMDDANKELMIMEVLLKHDTEEKDRLTKFELIPKKAKEISQKNQVEDQINSKLPILHKLENFIVNIDQSAISMIRGIRSPTPSVLPIFEYFAVLFDVSPLSKLVGKNRIIDYFPPVQKLLQDPRIFLMMQSFAKQNTANEKIVKLKDLMKNSKQIMEKSIKTNKDLSTIVKWFEYVVSSNELRDFLQPLYSTLEIIENNILSLEKEIFNCEKIIQTRKNEVTEKAESNKLIKMKIEEAENDLKIKTVRRNNVIQFNCELGKDVNSFQNEYDFLNEKIKHSEDICFYETLCVCYNAAFNYEEHLKNRKLFSSNSKVQNFDIDFFSHRKNILKKLKLNGISDLILREKMVAVLNGFVPPIIYDPDGLCLYLLKSIYTEAQIIFGFEKLNNSIPTIAIIEDIRESILIKDYYQNCFIFTPFSLGFVRKDKTVISENSSSISPKDSGNIDYNENSKFSKNEIERENNGYIDNEDIFQENNIINEDIFCLSKYFIFVDFSLCKPVNFEKDKKEIYLNDIGYSNSNEIFMEIFRENLFISFHIDEYKRLGKLEEQLDEMNNRKKSTIELIHNSIKRNPLDFFEGNSWKNCLAVFVDSSAEYENVRKEINRTKDLIYSNSNFNAKLISYFSKNLFFYLKELINRSNQSYFSAFLTVFLNLIVTFQEPKLVLEKAKRIFQLSYQNSFSSIFLFSSHSFMNIKNDLCFFKQEKKAVQNFEKDDSNKNRIKYNFEYLQNSFSIVFPKIVVNKEEKLHSEMHINKSKFENLERLMLRKIEEINKNNSNNKKNSQSYTSLSDMSNSSSAINSIDISINEDSKFSLKMIISSMISHVPIVIKVPFSEDPTIYIREMAKCKIVILDESKFLVNNDQNMETNKRFKNNSVEYLEKCFEDGNLFRFNGWVIIRFPEFHEKGFNVLQKYLTVLFSVRQYPTNFRLIILIEDNVEIPYFLSQISIVMSYPPILPPSKLYNNWVKKNKNKILSLQPNSCNSINCISFQKLIVSLAENIYIHSCFCDSLSIFVRPTAAPDFLSLSTNFYKSNKIVNNFGILKMKSSPKFLSDFKDFYLYDQNFVNVFWLKRIINKYQKQILNKEFTLIETESEFVSLSFTEVDGSFPIDSISALDCEIQEDEFIKVEKCFYPIPIGRVWLTPIPEENEEDVEKCNSILYGGDPVQLVLRIKSPGDQDCHFLLEV